MKLISNIVKKAQINNKYTMSKKEQKACFKRSKKKLKTFSSLTPFFYFSILTIIRIKTQLLSVTSVCDNNLTQITETTHSAKTTRVQTES